MIQLRPYQVEALDAIKEAAASGIRRPAVSLPTGSGKTVLFSALIKERGHPALILAHRDELLQQAVQKYNQIDPHTVVGTVKAGLNQTSHPVVVASIQTLAREKRLHQMPRDYKTIIVDEAHHSSADSYRRVIDYFEDCPLVVGVSATMERADSKNLSEVWDEVVYHRSILDMIEEEFLCDLRGLRVRLSQADFNKLKVSKGDFLPGQSAEMLSEAGAPEHAVVAYKEHAAGRKTIVFTPTVALAHEMATHFNMAGVKSEAVDGTTHPDERRAIFARFHEGATTVLANCGIATEGFDEPSVSCIIIARPTKSRILYTQMIGRGTRIYPTKDDCLIIDMADNTMRHDLMALPRLFGLRDVALNDPNQTLTGAVAHQKAADEAARQGKVVAERVELFKRRDFRWVVLAGDYFILKGRLGKIEIAPMEAENLYRVTYQLEGHALKRDENAKWRTHPPKTVLAEGVDLGYAQGIGEDYVRRAKATVLVSRNAPWAKAPATAKQRAALGRFGIVAPRDLTAGEASERLTRAIEEKRLRRRVAR